VCMIAKKTVKILHGFVCLPNQKNLRWSTSNVHNTAKQFTFIDFFVTKS
jgi:hypothetical protein